MAAAVNFSSHAIVVVDDDDAVRTSTARLLEREGYSVFCYDSGQALLDSGIPPDTDGIILDVWMPGLSGLDVLRALQRRGPGPPIIMLTGRADVSLAVEAMKLGASDFLEKPYRPSRLLDVLKRAGVARAGPSVSIVARNEASAKLVALTRRQREVLKRLALGESNKRIAHDLGLSIRTVESYRAQMMQKLGVRGTAQAVRIALLAGLLQESATLP
jgi:two-component system response regulator FixJ